MSRLPEKFTTDKLVDILRSQGESAFTKHYSLGMWSICTQAADEIERLRKVLGEIRDEISDGKIDTGDQCRDLLDKIEKLCKKAVA